MLDSLLAVDSADGTLALGLDEQVSVTSTVSVSFQYDLMNSQPSGGRSGVRAVLAPTRRRLPSEKEVPGPSMWPDRRRD